MNSQTRQIYKRFSTYTARGDQGQRIEALKEAAIAFALLVVRYVPAGHEHMRTVDAIDDALGHAVAGILRNEEWTQTENEVLVRPEERAEPMPEGLASGTWTPNRPEIPPDAIRKMQADKLAAVANIKTNRYEGEPAFDKTARLDRAITTSYL